MGTKSSHIIQKQVLNITLPNIKAALEWEVSERHIFTEIIRNQIERCFNEFNRNEDYLIIENLNLDLGAFTLNTLNEEMPQRLYNELLKILVKQGKSVLTQETFPGTGRENSGSETEQPKINDRLYTKQFARLEALFSFLHNGYLPWWASDIPDWDENWLQKLSENEFDNFKNFLSANDDRIILRLASEFSDEFIRTLLKRLGITVHTGKTWVWLKNVLENLQKKELYRSEKAIASKSTENTHVRHLSIPFLRRQYWFNWMEYALGRISIPDLHHLLDGHEELLKQIVLFMENKSLGTENLVLFGEVPEIWKNELVLLRKQAAVEETTGNLPLKNVPTPTEASFFPDFVSKDLAGKKNIPKAEHDEMLSVNEAGIILLHPFLPQLFRNCSWFVNDNFTDNYGKTMAVYALYYLATGKTEAPEHQLLLPKLLMGIPWSQPLEPVEELNDEEKTACDELLTEVVNHWKALGNTSPDGLREAYLQRSGKLEYLPGGWRLSVEHKTQDILLGRLPWGISVIKFPWMEGMLSVTWQ